MRGMAIAGAVLVCLLAASSAMATTFYDAGDGQVLTGNSWAPYVGVNITPGDRVDMIQAFRLPGDAGPNLEPPAIRNIFGTPSGWAYLGGTDVVAQAGGPATSTSFVFELWFVDPDQTTKFHLQAFYQGQYVAGSSVDITSTPWFGWHNITYSGDTSPTRSPISLQDPSHAPEPLTVAGVILGIGGIGAYIRRRRLA